MSRRDKINNALQNMGGKVKQAAGTFTHRGHTEMRGRRDQVKADLKDAGEQAKDAGGKAKDAFGH